MRKIPPTSTGMKLLDPVRPCSVAGAGERDRKLAFPLALALRVLEGVVERCEKLEPPLDSRVVISHFTNAFEGLVIREDAKLRAPYVASQAFDGPDNAASFQVKRSPVPLRIESSAADVSDGPH